MYGAAAIVGVCVAVYGTSFVLSYFSSAPDSSDKSTWTVQQLFDHALEAQERRALVTLSLAKRYLSTDSAALARDLQTTLNGYREEAALTRAWVELLMEMVT